MNEIGYLEVRAAGLGRRFHGEIRRAENLITRFPKSAQEVLPGIRKHILRKFPFSLIYSVEPDGLLILAVAHHRRRPRYWVRRASDTER
jgi:hypothetical protein